MYLVHRDTSTRKAFYTIPIQYEWVTAADPKVFETTVKVINETILEDEKKFEKIQQEISNEPLLEAKEEASEILADELEKQGYDALVNGSINLTKEQLDAGVELSDDAISLYSSLMELGDIDPDLEYKIADPFEEVYVFNVDIEDGDYDRYENDFAYRNSVNKRVVQIFQDAGVDVKPDVIQSMKGSIKMDVLVSKGKLDQASAKKLEESEDINSVEKVPFFQTLMDKLVNSAIDQANVKKVETAAAAAREQRLKNEINQASTADIIKANRGLNGFLSTEPMFDTVESGDDCPIVVNPKKGCPIDERDLVMVKHKQPGKPPVACCRPLKSILKIDNFSLTPDQYRTQYNKLRKDAYLRFASQLLHIIKWNRLILDGITKIRNDVPGLNKEKYFAVESALSTYAQRADTYRAKIEYALKFQSTIDYMNLYELYNANLREYLEIRGLYRKTRIAMTNLSDNINYVDVEDNETWSEYFKNKLHNFLEYTKSSLIALSTKAWNNKIGLILSVITLSYIFYPLISAAGQALLMPGIGSIYVGFSTQLGSIVAVAGSIFCHTFITSSPIGRAVLLRSISYALLGFLGSLKFSGFARFLASITKWILSAVGLIRDSFSYILKKFGGDPDEIDEEAVLRAIDAANNNKKNKIALIFGGEMEYSDIVEWLIWIYLSSNAETLLDWIGWGSCKVTSAASRLFAMDTLSQQGENSFKRYVETGPFGVKGRRPTWDNWSLYYKKEISPEQLLDLQSKWQQEQGINDNLFSRMGISALVGLQNVAKTLYACKGSVTWNQYVWLVLVNAPYWLAALLPVIGFIYTTFVVDKDVFETSKILELLSRYSAKLRSDPVDPTIHFENVPIL
jgi:hypothetical protein